ncbi:hypothetical protein FPCIR_10695 [Fusarium pseudocircinatum]|uniref:Uncharacterized protein n=1 Tax=Fusarium pseudocircinatum TaxID=56676 RepID=A0A8H5KW51_9HYPO|nr:hypothetical protein FPCIR_10695 [Fusarium pseudocircinatum]
MESSSTVITVLLANRLFDTLLSSFVLTPQHSPCFAELDVEISASDGAAQGAYIYHLTTVNSVCLQDGGQAGRRFQAEREMTTAASGVVLLYDTSDTEGLTGTWVESIGISSLRTTH